MNAATVGPEPGNEPIIEPIPVPRMIGPNDPMILPDCTEQLDWEAELTTVIGKRCRHVKKADAARVIFGYTAMNDGSIREYQRKSA